MIIIEERTNPNNDKKCKYIYSDQGYCIENKGCIYDNVYAPLDSERVYTETNILINGDEEAELEDYENALQEVGVL